MGRKTSQLIHVPFDPTDPWSFQGVNQEVAHGRKPERAIIKRKSVTFNNAHDPVDVVETYEKHGWTNTMIWEITLDGHQHVFELEHSTFLGKRKVKINGKKVMRRYKFFDTGSKHHFMFCNHKLTLQILPIGTQFCYRLFVNDQMVKEANAEKGGEKGEGRPQGELGALPAIDN